MSQKNELFALVESKQNELWEIKANFLKEEQSVYFKRALLYVSQNSDLMKITKGAGAKSIFNCISNALQMGLKLGGQIPHAHIVPMKETATLIPTADGYKFIALTDPPVLKSFIVRAVYDGEKFSLNYTTGEVNHEIDYKTKRGDLMGVYCMITELDGVKKAEFMYLDDINHIRNTYSPTWKAVKAKKLSENYCPWLTDPVMMALKTATKRFLKPYASLKEGLLWALSLQEETPEQDNRPIESRAGSILDDAIEVDATVEMTAEAEKPEEKKPPEIPAENKPDKNLF